MSRKRGKGRAGGVAALSLVVVAALAAGNAGVGAPEGEAAPTAAGGVTASGTAAGDGVVTSGSSSPVLRDSDATERPRVSRLTGNTRYDTAAAIVMHRGASETPPLQILLVRGDRPLDAVAASTMGAAVLFVPSSGPIPASVIKAYRATKPAEMRQQVVVSDPVVTVVGSERALPTAQVRKLIGKTRFTRIASDNPSHVSLAQVSSQMVDHNKPNLEPDDEPSTLEGTVISARAPLAVAAAAAQVRLPRLLVAPDSGPWPDVRKANPNWAENTWPGPMLRVGGKAALSDERMRSLNASLPKKPGVPAPAVVDMAGRDRYATGVLLARAAFPHGARTVYLADGVSGVDAAAATGLVDGPVLPVPPCGDLPESITGYLRELGPHHIVALGNPASVCDSTLEQAAAATTPKPSRRAVDVSASWADLPEGFAACTLDEAGAVQCRGEAYPISAHTKRGRRAPHQVPQLTSGVTELAGSSLCARTDGGALLCPDPSKPGVPWVPVQGLTSGVTNGGNGCCVIKEGGVPWCRDTMDRPHLRAEAIPGITGAVQVAGTRDFGCALDTTGGVRCWGILGSEADSDPDGDAKTVTVEGLPEGVVQIDALNNSSWISVAPQRIVMRTRDGRALVLGDPGAPASERPPIQELEGGARRLAADGSGTLITLDGRIGTNAEGIAQLRSNLPDITDGDDPLVDLSMVSAISQWGCAKRESGAVNCWDFFGGENTNLLGDGAIADRLSVATPLGYEGLPAG